MSSASTEPAITAPCVPTAKVYVDGFNLYYGCLQESACRWLDLEALCRRLLPGRHVKRIRYFTARVKGPAAQRQDVYLRALATLRSVSIHQGTFLAHTVLMPVADRPHPRATALVEYRAPSGVWHGLTFRHPGRPMRASVRKQEEKGSDVNLATFLLLDAFRRDCDEAYVLSGDSDLATPISVANRVLSLPVGVINPTANRLSAELQRAARTYRTLRPAILRTCLLPPLLVDAGGRPIRKPPGW